MFIEKLIYIDVNGNPTSTMSFRSLCSCVTIIICVNAYLCIIHSVKCYRYVLWTRILVIFFLFKKSIAFSVRLCESRVVHNLALIRFALKLLKLHKYPKRSNYGSRHRTFIDKTFGIIDINVGSRFGALLGEKAKYNITSCACTRRRLI